MPQAGTQTDGLLQACNLLRKLRRHQRITQDQFKRIEVLATTLESQLKCCILEAEQQATTESETAEILADPTLMESIRKGEADIKAGRVHDHDDVVAELDAELTQDHTESAPLVDMHTCKMCGKAFDYNASMWTNGTICSGGCLHALERSEPSTPPIEVEMRLNPPPRSCDKWGWECCLADLWILGSYNDRDLYFPRDYEAKASGEAWLANLSEHLGVPLVAKWVGEF